MFKVKAKETVLPIYYSITYTVYDIRNDNSGYPRLFVETCGNGLF
jgi:hypothetical protein